MPRFGAGTASGFVGGEFCKSLQHPEVRRPRHWCWAALLAGSVPQGIAGLRKQYFCRSMGAIRSPAGTSGTDGRIEFIQEVSREQAESQRIRCPKCDQILTGREMRQHALTEHQRIFDGRALRRPWSVAVETLETYANHPDAALLNRGEKLAQVE